ncbi:hypothetical protein LVJ94_53030 [Pendulispora rubella]|uniref:Uncharacterized protein n=1 Tax=Pendulispora rubella TaxID=2741070 RepID=A0ABZ2L7S8_9BACT
MIGAPYHSACRDILVGGLGNTRLFSLWLGVGVFLFGASAHANPTARLVYVRSAGATACPDEEALRTAVAARLGYEPFRHTAPVTIVARVTRVAGLYRGEVELLDENGIERGTRALAERTDRCEDVVAAMALTVSIAIDPLSLTRSAPPPDADANVVNLASTPPPAPTPAPAPPPPPVAEEPREPVTPPTPRTRPFVGTTFIGAFGVEPAASFGLSAFVGLRAKTFSVAVEGRADLATSTDVAPAGQVSSNVVLGSFVPCFHAGPAFLCPVVSLGMLSGSSSSIVGPRSTSTFFASGGARLGVQLDLSGPLALFSATEVGMPMTRPEFRIDGRTVYTQPAITGSVLLGLLVNL